MTVKSQPKWVIEPKDQTAIVGETVNFNCQAGKLLKFFIRQRSILKFDSILFVLDGYPAPLIRWKMAKDSRAEFKSISSNYHIQTLGKKMIT